ncbi:helix-turn-helix domain-containing protein [Tumebacillus lipolyticus]|uniref:Tetratricopeptide repeat protein n=1 Tax=Tumebacillus lipolyticus TaxID=1280370 RepID=A0ABW4ZXA2_9BACL
METNMNLGEIGNRIRFLRKEKGLSQRELAVGVCSESALSQIENGNYPSMPSNAILQGLCEKLDTSFGELLNRIASRKSIETDVLLDYVKGLIHRREFQSAIQILDEVGTRSLHKYQKIDLIICFSDCHIGVSEMERAIALLSNLHQELEADRETDPKVLATVFNKLGIAWQRARNLVNAYNYYTRAYQNSLRFPEPDILCGNISYNLGNSCRWLRLDNEARTYLEHAIKVYEKATDPKKLADAYFVLGIVYKNQEQYVNAGEYFKKALVLYETLEIVEWVLEAKHHYAFFVQSQQSPEEAIPNLIEAANEYERIKDKRNQAYLYAQVCVLYQHVDDFEQAKQYISSALDLFTRDEAEGEAKYAYVYRVFSNYLIDIKEYAMSIEYSVISSEIFGKMGLEKESADSLEAAVIAYKAQGNLAQALEFSEKRNRLLRNPAVLFVTPK